MSGNSVRPANPFPRFPAEEIEQSIPARFALMVERYPDRLAVKDKNNELTYQQLDQAAHRVARAILARSAPREEPVALHLDQGIDAITAILGALKSGRPYVFLDPALASERNEFILKDSGARLVVSDTANFSKAGSCNGLSSINIDECRDDAPCSDERLAVGPDSPACLIYTSGSTGAPKGVVQTHRSLLAVTMNYTNCFHLSCEDRLCFFYSPSVIAAVRIIWLALCNGAALCMHDLRVEGIAKLAHWLRQERITLFTAVASVFRQFTGVLTDQDQFPDLRLIRLGGEPTLPGDVASYKKHFSGNCLLVNRIGSTETGTYSWFCIDKETRIDGASVPVGYPMDGYEVFLRDEDGAEVEADQVGEIVVKSRYLPAGFWNRPDLTIASFLPVPDGGDERMYRTGDLGRRLPDGCLIHLGRKDHQVKVRGHRVEVAEIEAVLRDLDTVKETVVMPWKGRAGEQHLVAYFVPEAERTPTITALRRELGRKLPAYMVPSYFVQLPEFPRAAGGKINRGALPSPGGLRPLLPTLFVAPRNATEVALARLWIEVLGLDEVGVHDRFLELGGDSLRAMQLVARILDAFHVDLPLRTLLDSPTIAGMAEALALHQAGAAERSDGAVATFGRSIPRRKTTGPRPLSFSQERLWFLSQLDEIGSAYHVPTAFRLRGPLNRSALANALQAVVDRHEVLRTTYQAVDGVPLQVIHDRRTMELELIDLSQGPQSPDDETLRELVNREAQRRFDLSRDLMIRATLLRLQEEDHIFLVVMHHIASDGAGGSSRTLARELSRFYAAYSRGHSASLPELPMQYADFAEWQRGRLGGRVLEQQLAYWKDRLAGSPPLLSLPADRPRPFRQTYRGACEQLEFPAELSSALGKLSREQRVTLFMTLLSGWQTLLHRYTGSEDIVVGAPTLGRSRIEIEDLIGFFGNTLVLRTDLSGNPTFRQLTERVRDVALSAYARPDLPFERLVAELQREHELDHSPLFQVMFVFQRTDGGALSLDGLQAEPMRAGTATSKFDLTLAIEERDGLLAGTLEYNTDLFERATASRLLGHYRTLLEAVAKDPDRPISSIALLSDRERRQVLVECNGTARECPGATCIHERVAAQAGRTPDAVAVLCEDQRLTYRELDRRANRLAHRLQSVGVGPEVRVGVCADRSIPGMVGLLAILKAGGAYVPLDPACPGERLAFMLEDAGVTVLLTQRSLLEKFPAHDARALCLDDDREAIAADAETAPDCAVTADNLAYVIYTSGSTGRPKGVAMAHGPLVNLIAWQREHSGCGEGARTLQFAPLAFDVSFQEIFSTWCAGGTLVLINDDQRRDPAEMLRVIDRQRVERLFLPVAALEQLAAAAGARNAVLPTLREVITSGEQLRITPSIARLFERIPRCKLVNQYGPTEAHVVAAHELTGNPASWARLPPIGRPIANASLYVLDGDLEPVPVGIAGELHIGGAALARGYLNRPELTAEKFIPDPFSTAPFARLYKTGDRARHRPDGSIEFLGRSDDQVKIRGFRVEPGEIEAALAAHPAVLECAVSTWEHAPGDRRVVAYVVSGDRRTPSVEALRSFLEDKLSEYMIPSAIVQLEALPLSANGKLNRRALPPPEATREALAQGFVAPRTELEEKLARIWAEVLTLDRVGIHDNFFDLGGHSLMAARIAGRASSRLGLEIPLLTIFLSPTIAEVAATLRTDQPARPDSPRQRW